MFDDTYERIPSEGWMFLPLLNYEGGGPAAWFEPLSQHQEEFDFALAQYFGAGVMACYRGDRIFDSDSTKILVQKWVNFYKKYREILNGDLIHVRRADMQGLDAFLHVLPKRRKGLLMIFNPTSNLVTETDFQVNLYYTGLYDRAFLSREGDKSTWSEFKLDRDYAISLKIQLKPKSFTWYLIN